MVVVEPGDGRACSGCGHDGGNRRADGCHRGAGSGGRGGPSRPAAHVYPRARNVSAPGAGATRRRSLARPRARCGPPLAHADPHRHSVRVLPGDRRLERRRGRRRSQAVRVRQGPRGMAHAVIRPQLPLHALRGDVSRSVPRRDGGDDGHAGGHSGVRAARGEPADGGLAGRLRGDAGARADPLRPMARHHRHAVARGSGALLRDHRHAPLRQGSCARGARGRARGKRGTQAIRSGDGAGACRRARCSTTPAWTSSRSRRRCSTAR